MSSSIQKRARTRVSQNMKKTESVGPSFPAQGSCAPRSTRGCGTKRSGLGFSVAGFNILIYCRQASRACCVTHVAVIHIYLNVWGAALRGRRVAMIRSVGDLGSRLRGLIYVFRVVKRVARARDTRVATIQSFLKVLGLRTLINARLPYRV